MLASADHPVLVVDRLDRGLRTFRCIPPELWAASEHGCCAYAVPSHGPRPAPLTSACDARRMVRSGRPGPQLRALRYVELATMMEDLYQRGDRQRLFLAYVDLTNLQ